MALKLIEHAPDADTLDSIEAERRGAELQARLAAIDPRVVRVYEAGDADGLLLRRDGIHRRGGPGGIMRRGRSPPASPLKSRSRWRDAGERAQSAGGDRRQGLPRHRPRRHQAEEHPHRCRGEVRVLDFGIAKALSLSRRLTRNEFGSVPYASPERLDIGEVDVRSRPVVAGRHALRNGRRACSHIRPTSTERLERMIRSRIPPPPGAGAHARSRCGAS